VGKAAGIHLQDEDIVEKTMLDHLGTMTVVPHMVMNG
jgi:hypothetical protein